ncbi:MAG TPA: potassium/proton antiporter [Albitalea sp.]|uniref:potassium/proton antiporter n=1 Tax=Piscinibacter sp. TaxID=1903157 RepID=UPI002ED3A78C
MNLLLLAGGLLVLTSLLAGVFSARLGLSFLLIFLVAGMLAGEDGPGGLKFDDPRLPAWVGNVALAIILLEGGLNTRMSTFRSGFAPALLLATVGVGVTACVVGAVAMSVLDIDWRYGLLLGAIVGSTDAAAVFSMLRQFGLRLHERVSATLEIESGLNDPMAVFLVLALIETIRHDAGPADLGLLLLRQGGLGAAIGWGGGAAMAWLLRKMPLGAEHGGLLSLLIVNAGLVLFALAGLAEASGFLAVYLFGLRVRARAEDAAHAASSALDGFAWAAQATMFLLLGLFVAPRQMLASAGHTVAIAATLMFVARPLAVFLCLAPLRFPVRHTVFIAWVGLRGAVPIVLALFPVLERVPDSGRFFNVAFAVVLASLLLQGTTLGATARRLGVIRPPEEPPPGEGAVQGRLVLDADLPLAEVFGFFQLPLPQHTAATLGDWMTQTLARDHAEGDGLDWHGAHFRITGLQDGRIARVGITLAPRAG